MTNEQKRSPGRPEKYPKTDFSGNLAEQARMIRFIEDCDVRFVGKQIRVGTGTTHSPMLRLFNEILGGYGHVSKTSAYNRQFSIYQWQLQVYLNSSFGFLPECKENPVRFLSEILKNGHEVVRIASLTDTEGHVGIDANDGHPGACLFVTNNNRQLLEWTQTTIGGGISRHSNGYQFQLRGEEAVATLQKLPVAHEEKAAAKGLILHHADNGGIGMEALRAYQELRRKIDQEVRICTLQDRLDWTLRHGRPHPDDPDQTIPKNLNLSPSFSQIAVLPVFS